MPKPGSRDKDASSKSNRRKKDPTASSRWVAPVMVALLLLGLVWIIVYYVAGEDVPLVRDIGGWNLVIGMGMIMAGFMAATKWQ